MQYETNEMEIIHQEKFKYISKQNCRLYKIEMIKNNRGWVKWNISVAWAALAGIHVLPLQRRPWRQPPCSRPPRWPLWREEPWALEEGPLFIFDSSMPSTMSWRPLNKFKELMSPKMLLVPSLRKSKSSCPRHLTKSWKKMLPRGNSLLSEMIHQTPYAVNKAHSIFQIP